MRLGKLVSNQCNTRVKIDSQFPLGLSFNQNTFRLLSSFEKDITETYWKTKHYYLNNSDLQMMNWVVEQLLINERPLNALDATCVFYG